MRRVAAMLLGAAVLAAGSACADDAAVAPSTAPATTSAAATPPAAPARSDGFALVPDGPGAVARARARAGATVRVGLRLANASDAPRTLALTSSVPWLAVPAEVTVPPRQSVAVVARGTAPSAGVQRGAVVARAEGDRGAVVSVSYESAVRVIVGVTP